MKTNALLLVLPLLLFGCDDSPNQICKDGIVYYQNIESKNVYVKGSHECIDIRKVQEE